MAHGRLIFLNFEASREKSRIFLQKRESFFSEGVHITCTRGQKNRMILIYYYLWADFDFTPHLKNNEFKVIRDWIQFFIC